MCFFYSLGGAMSVHATGFFFGWRHGRQCSILGDDSPDLVECSNIAHGTLSEASEAFYWVKNESVSEKRGAVGH